MDAHLGGVNLFVERQELLRQTFKANAGNGRQPGIVWIGDPGTQHLDLHHADPCDDAELRHVGAHRIDQHGSLTDQHFSGSVHHQNALPLNALHGHEAHRRTASQSASASAASLLFRFT